VVGENVMCSENAVLCQQYIFVSWLQGRDEHPATSRRHILSSEQFCPSCLWIAAVLSEDLALPSFRGNNCHVFQHWLTTLLEWRPFSAEKLCVFVFGRGRTVIDFTVPHLLVEALSSSVQVITFIVPEVVLRRKVNRVLFYSISIIPEILRNFKQRNFSLQFVPFWWLWVFWTLWWRPGRRYRLGV